MANPVIKKNKSRFGFINETIAELKKVAWLSRREAFYLTGLVLLVAITVGAILGAIDYGFSFIVDELIISK
ncbi:MAG: preprotein translocase subunit SecE [Dehalococcoidia bacterium]|nr:MAG: preprotein translocase subunit SecE [Dehalococcoidia bacterium]